MGEACKWDDQENQNEGMLRWRCGIPKWRGRTSFNLTVHLPEAPGHKAQLGPPKHLGTRAPSDSWTCSFLAAHAGQSLQPLSIENLSIPFGKHLQYSTPPGHLRDTSEGHTWPSGSGPSCRLAMKNISFWPDTVFPFQDGSQM